jgi:hypothetical protein
MVVVPVLRGELAVRNADEVVVSERFVDGDGLRCGPIDVGPEQENQQRRGQDRAYPPGGIAVGTNSLTPG